MLRRFMPMKTMILAAAAAMLVLSSCASDEPDGIADASPAETTVKFDFYHKPLPEIPLPNDVATRFDATSATHRRVNASILAPTLYERRTRELIDELDGFGTFQPITIPFTGPLDVSSIVAGHRDVDYRTDNDVIYLIDIDPNSPEFGQLKYLDLGEGNFPTVLEERSRYWDNDPRAGTISLLFEEADEDLNHNGVLDAGEDTDADGVLDKPNYLPGANPPADNPAARADAIMAFYERETNSIIARPLVPLRERTTYAVVITKRVKDIHGNPVGSPFEAIHHTAQTEALRPLAKVLPHGLTLDDVAFAFTYTTGTVQKGWQAVRDGLYGYGVQRHLATEYPADIDGLFELRDASKFPNSTMRHLLWGETWREAGAVIATTFLGLSQTSQEYRILDDSLKYIDYFAIGSYKSPQLYKRRDAQGNFLPLNDQSWPQDLDRLAAEAEPETVYFTVAVPRKEVSVRAEGKPAPVVILGHGYGGNRFPVMQFAGYLARHGLATIAIDGPSHGIGLSPEQDTLARTLLAARGLGGLATATFLDRAFDQDGDGQKDSGADFWTSYLFHTRDIVRQFMLDYSQLIRIMRSWDGQKRWMDLDGDGTADIAGDFDLDGKVDVGGDGLIQMTGGSLGGIMSMIMGGAEPAVSAIVPISGGGGYADMGMRTLQGGAIEAFVLRALGPLYSGNLDLASGVMNLDTIVVDLNSSRRQHIGSIAGVAAGDLMVAENLISGERSCGVITAEGHTRASLQCDKGDRVRISVYAGSQWIPGSYCGLVPGAQPKGILDRFDSDFAYHAQPFKAGDPLVSLEDGLGRARNTPELRRMQGLAQMVLEPGDPISYAPSVQLSPLTFATGEHTGAHTLEYTSQGDMNVPAASGVSWGRAAGLIDFLHDDTRFGVPPNQMLISTYTTEAVDNLKRAVDANGKGVHTDIEVLSGGDDIWGAGYPRLSPPLHAGADRADKLGGRSAALFPLTRDTGQHGFDFPGAMIDDARERCRNSCQQTGGSDPCNCKSLVTYDVGNYLLNMAGEFLSNDGKVLTFDTCHSSDTCAYKKTAPAARPAASLP